jgi:hypothetical protein
MKTSTLYLLTGLLFISLISPAVGAYQCPTDMGSFWDWVTCVRANWIYEDDADDEPCTTHLFSLIRLRGDCDDFAVLVAWAADEIFGLDSFILLLMHSSWEYGHAVAFVEATSESHYERTKKSCARETAITYPLTDYTYPEVYTDHPGTSKPRTYYIPVDSLRYPESVMNIDVNNLIRYPWLELEGDVL